MLTARDRPTGFPTEESTLTAHKTDVIIACFGMGESFAGEKGLEEFKSQLKALIDSHTGKKYNGKSKVRLILVSPIAYEDLGKLTPGRDKRNRELQAYARAMPNNVILLVDTSQSMKQVGAFRRESVQGMAAGWQEIGISDPATAIT